MDAIIRWRTTTEDEVCVICQKKSQTAEGYSLVTLVTNSHICEECGEKNFPELMKEIDHMSFD